MMLGLVVIVGFYMLGIALIHALLGMRESERPTYYVLQTRNNQLQLEWYLRSLFFFSWVKGRSIHVTVVDEQSTDDTLEIAGRIHKEQEQCIEICRLEPGGWEQWLQEHEEDAVVVIRLTHSEDLDSAYKALG